MISVDIKQLLRRMNPFCTRSLEAAAGLCVASSHYEVTPEHLLLKLVEDPHADIQIILRHFGQTPSHVQKAIQGTLKDFRAGNSGRPVFSPQLVEWIQGAWLIGSIDLVQTEIRSGLLLIGLLEERSGRFIGASYLTAMEGVETANLKKKFFEITSVSSEAPVGDKETAKGSGSKERGEETALGRFTIDFTARARGGEIDPVFCRDEEIRQMIDILARRRKNNPIVVGEAGVGKTAVVEGLALKVVQGDVPDLLKQVDILGLDMGLLQAGAGMKGEFENRLKSVISEVKSSAKPIILFIDEAHTLIGAGGSAGMSDAANLLKPALARGELRTIAATTWSEYKKYFEKDAALARRFQLVSLDEPSEEEAIVILRGLKEKYEASHGVQILDQAVVAAAQMSSRYLSGRLLPDKAVDLLDTASARVKIGLSDQPASIADAERQIKVWEQEKGALERDQVAGVSVDQDRLIEIGAAIEQKRADWGDLKKRWEEEKTAAETVLELRRKREGAEPQILQDAFEAAQKNLQQIQGTDPLFHLEVNEKVIASVISDWTGIPVGRMVQDEARLILQLEARLSERVKGQGASHEIICKGIRASKAGLGHPGMPTGVFLMVGPSGVGKTETAIAVADLLFGGERFMTTINMSEFQEKHTLSRLIGSPPGYVGYGEGGVLTEAVRQRPYSVVLLDEVEKGSPDVMNLFYQVFDKGVLADGEGRIIDFKNTVLFLTSNLGSDEVVARFAVPPYPTVEETVALIRPMLNRYFKPALLGRMTIVPFAPLAPDVLKEIVALKLKQLANRMMESHRITFTYEPDVIEQIAARCTEVTTGARNIDHIMRGTLLPMLSTEILNRMGEGPLPTGLKLGDRGSGDFYVEWGEGEGFCSGFSLSPKVIPMGT